MSKEENGVSSIAELTVVIAVLAFHAYPYMPRMVQGWMIDAIDHRLPRRVRAMMRKLKSKRPLYSKSPSSCAPRRCASPSKPPSTMGSLKLLYRLPGFKPGAKIKE